MPQLQQGAKPRDFTDVATMRRHYRELHTRTWTPRGFTDEEAAGRPVDRLDLNAEDEPADAQTLAAKPETAREPSSVPEPARLAPGAFTGNLQAWGPIQTPALRLVAQVAAWHGLTPADILGLSRTLAVIEARHDAIAAVCLSRPDMPYTVVARVFERDHSSIIHAVKRRGCWAPQVKRRGAPGARVA